MIGKLLVRIVLLGGLAAGALGAARDVVRRRTSPEESEREGAGGSGHGRLRRRLTTAGAVLLLLGAGGALVAASGIVPIKASAGHWAVTRWFLEFSMRRSIVTHTLGDSSPPLDDPSLVVRGAGHYDLGCRPCHGSPELPRPRIAMGMLPVPPYLAHAAPAWEPDELFYIVKHGVKLTGMPAWPAQQRDDEVWAVVAFLRVLPGLDAEGYRRLARGALPVPDAPAPLAGLAGPGSGADALLLACARCHGLDGDGRGTGAFPRIGGQRLEYLRGALGAFARGERHSGIMEPIAAGLSDAEQDAIARHYAAARPPAPAAREAPDPATDALAGAIARGREIATRGIPAQRVPSCADCHGPGAPPTNGAYPVLAGQYPEYLVLQLELFKQGHRGGSPYARLMQPIAGRLTEDQIRDVATYYGSLASSLDREER